MLSLIDLLKRKCEACRACCTSIAVEELGKPFNMPCTHLCDKGCAIHKTKPDSCAGYECLWLSGMFEFADRPDKIGAVFHPHDIPGEGLWIDVFLTSPETDTDRVLELIEEVFKVLVDIRGVRMIRYNQVFNTQHAINLKNYPNGANVGVGSNWKSPDKKVWMLDAPDRFPLTVIEDKK